MLLPLAATWAAAKAQAELVPGRHDLPQSGAPQTRIRRAMFVFSAPMDLVNSRLIILLISHVLRTLFIEEWMNASLPEGNFTMS